MVEPNPEEMEDQMRNETDAELYVNDDTILDEEEVSLLVS